MRQNLRKALASLAILIMSNTFASALELLFVDLTINYRHYGTALLLRDGDANYYATVSDLAKWGVRGPYVDRLVRDGREFVRLESLGRIAISYDAQTASATVSIPAELLPTQQLSLRRDSAPDTVSSTGAYLDYDWSYTSAGSSFPSGLLAPTFFSESGVLHTKILYQGYDPPDTTIGASSNRSQDWIRLDTTFSRDFPDNMRTLRIGDTVAAAGPWGSAQYVGGVQFASNFGTQPAFISFPTPSFQGSASLPSTLDLYVDGTLRHRQNLDAGPFRADQIPVITGAGEMQMVVTDILGREQLYSQNFYTGAELLRPGLSDFSYTLGALRENFGFASNDYGDVVLLAEHRYGLNEIVTVGGRTEVSSSTKLLSATVDWSPRMTGVVNLGLGLSDSDSGSGHSWLAGYRYQARDFNIGARVSGTSRSFSGVGATAFGGTPKTQLIINGGWNHPRAGSFGVALVHMDFHDAEARDVITFNHSKTFFQRYFFSIYANYVKDTHSDVSVGVNVNTTFGPRHNATASFSQDGDNSFARMEAQSTLPTGPGYGYRVGKTIGDIERFDARFVGQTNYGRYQLETDQYGDVSSTRVSASGSIAWLAGRPYFTREINDGFAVARVGNLKDVRVYVENQEVGRSDDEGRLLLPRLRPYEVNRIRIEPVDLPMATVARTISMEVAPAFRSGIVINFPVSTPSVALIRAFLPNGEPVPSGAAVSIEGEDAKTVVGLDGTIYITGTAGRTVISVDILPQACQFEIELPPADQTLPHLGDFECTTVRP
jgi:outer membrane usher protein